VAEQVENSENGNGRIIINDNESNLQKIAKSEQWCKQSLGVTEADYIWCIRLGDTYAHVREYDAASEQYKKVGKSLALRRIGRVLTWDDRLPQFSKLKTPSTRSSCEMCSKLSANSRPTPNVPWNI
jgi:hypothetical protein